MEESRDNTIFFAVPGDIETLTGGYNYDRRLLKELTVLGWNTKLSTLAASFPFPNEADVTHAVDQLNACDPDVPVIVDGLAFGAIPHEKALHLRGGLIALCHHPLGLEAGLSPARETYLLANEKANLQRVDRVIVTSALTADTLRRDFSVPEEKLVVAEPGTDRAQRAIGSSGHVVELLCVGSCVERKGYDILLQALSELRDLPWRLRIAGSLDRAPEYSKKITGMTEALQLEGKVDLLGEVEDAVLQNLYHASDVFILASHYEGYGMVLAEAMARGLAIVSTTGGAAAQTVPDTAALKVPPGDTAALRDAMRRAISDGSLRQQLSEASWQAGQKLSTWSEAAQIVAGVAVHVAKGLVR